MKAKILSRTDCTKLAVYPDVLRAFEQQLLVDSQLAREKEERKIRQLPLEDKQAAEPESKHSSQSVEVKQSINAISLEINTTAQTLFPFPEIAQELKAAGLQFDGPYYLLRTNQAGIYRLAANLRKADGSQKAQVSIKYQRSTSSFAIDSVHLKVIDTPEAKPIGLPGTNWQKRDNQLERDIATYDLRARDQIDHKVVDALISRYNLYCPNSIGEFAEISPLFVRSAIGGRGQLTPLEADLHHIGFHSVSDFKVMKVSENEPEEFLIVNYFANSQKKSGCLELRVVKNDDSWQVSECFFRSLPDQADLQPPTIHLPNWQTVNLTGDLSELVVAEFWQQFYECDQSVENVTGLSRLFNNYPTPSGTQRELNFLQNNPNYFFFYQHLYQRFWSTDNFLKPCFYTPYEVRKKKSLEQTILAFYRKEEDLIKEVLNRVFENPIGDSKFAHSYINDRQLEKKQLSEKKSAEEDKKPSLGPEIHRALFVNFNQITQAALNHNGLLNAFANAVMSNFIQGLAAGKTPEKAASFAVGIESKVEDDDLERLNLNRQVIITSLIEDLGNLSYSPYSNRDLMELYKFYSEIVNHSQFSEMAIAFLRNPFVHEKDVFKGLQLIRFIYLANLDEKPGMKQAIESFFYRLPSVVLYHLNQHDSQCAALKYFLKPFYKHDSEDLEEDIEGDLELPWQKMRQCKALALRARSQIESLVFITDDHKQRTRTHPERKQTVHGRVTQLLANYQRTKELTRANRAITRPEFIDHLDELKWLMRWYLNLVTGLPVVLTDSLPVVRGVLLQTLSQLYQVYPTLMESDQHLLDQFCKFHRQSIAGAIIQYLKEKPRTLSAIANALQMIYLVYRQKLDTLVGVEDAIQDFIKELPKAIAAQIADLNDLESLKQLKDFLPDGSHLSWFVRGNYLTQANKIHEQIAALTPDNSQSAVSEAEKLESDFHNSRRSTPDHSADDEGRSSQSGPSEDNRSESSAHSEESLSEQDFLSRLDGIKFLTLQYLNDTGSLFLHDLKMREVKRREGEGSTSSDETELKELKYSPKSPIGLSSPLPETALGHSFPSIDSKEKLPEKDTVLKAALDQLYHSYQFLNITNKRQLNAWLKTQKHLDESFRTSLLDKAVASKNQYMDASLYNRWQCLSAWKKSIAWIPILGWALWYAWTRTKKEDLDSLVFPAEESKIGRRSVERKSDRPRKPGSRESSGSEPASDRSFRTTTPTEEKVGLETIGLTNLAERRASGGSDHSDPPSDPPSERSDSPALLAEPVTTSPVDAKPQEEDKRSTSSPKASSNPTSLFGASAASTHQPPSGEEPEEDDEEADEEFVDDESSGEVYRF